MMKKNNRKLPFSLIVTGMHRSGTSALTGVLTKLGFHSGKRLLPANRFNERGYFEDEYIVQQHDLLLNSLGRSWYDERPFPSDWIKNKNAINIKNRLKDIFIDEFDSNTYCVIKDPRICRFVPIWNQIFSELNISSGYIILLRNPLEICESLLFRDRLPRDRSSLLYLSYLIEAEKETRHMPRVFVDYDSILKNWKKPIKDIEIQFKLNLQIDDQSKYTVVENFISADLKHFSTEIVKSKISYTKPLEMAETAYNLLRSNLNESVFSNLSELQKELYHYLSSIDPLLNHSAHSDIIRQEIFNQSSRSEQIADLYSKSSVYWCLSDKKKFQETESVSQQLNFGKGQDKLKFKLHIGEKKINALRWDITNCPAFCELFKVWIENDKGACVWQWKFGTSLFVAPSPDMNIVYSKDNKESIWVLSLGFDPHAQLRIPKNIIMGIKNNWVLCAVLKVDLLIKSTPVLLDQIRKSKNLLKDTILGIKDVQLSIPSLDASEYIPDISSALDEVTTILNKILSSKNKQIVQYQKEIRNLSTTQKQASENIIRTEAQLDILKEMLLHKN